MDEENEDSRLQQAIKEMRRLDEVLSAKISREKEVRCQRKELQAKLWQELLVDITLLVHLIAGFHS